MAKVVFHLKIISRLCGHARSGPVNANDRLSFQSLFIFILFRERIKKKDDVGRTETHNKIPRSPRRPRAR